MNNNRYKVPNDEGFEPGSDDTVLKNFLGITSIDTIESIEEQELLRAELELINIFDEDHQFSAQDILNIHELWLGDIYPSAGKYRTVSMQKDNFLFANPNHLERLMIDLENKFLKNFTPCHFADNKQLSNAIGIVHIELILIHPFREGNGRCARLLADLMAMQSGRPPLNFTLIDQNNNVENFNKYISAIQSGLDRDYQPISSLIEKLLESNN